MAMETGPTGSPGWVLVTVPPGTTSILRVMVRSSSETMICKHRTSAGTWVMASWSVPRSSGEAVVSPWFATQA
jgi:hypothetical protein